MDLTTDLSAALAQPPSSQRPRFDVERQCLVGSRCESCGATAWPGRAVCHRCGSAEIAFVGFAGRGLLLSFTRVHVPRPGLEDPYLLGQVRLQGGPVVFGPLAGAEAAVAVGREVRTRIRHQDNGASVYFEVV